MSGWGPFSSDRHASAARAMSAFAPKADIEGDAGYLAMLTRLPAENLQPPSPGATAAPNTRAYRALFDFAPRALFSRVPPGAGPSAIFRCVRWAARIAR